MHRVQLIRNMGVIEQQPLLTVQAWESIRASGPSAVEKWIDEQMKYKQAVVVLIGAETASRSWVRYEIEKAHRERRPLLGVHIHGLSSLGRTDPKGRNPFHVLGIPGIEVRDPAGVDTAARYRDINANMESWIESAIRRQKLVNAAVLRSG